ncbi:uncharacterized protein, partial [Phyllobates terribilis]|uniref:uncharacterized protein n=1 Tax=Phyllobates terribilis TaxID=111132 RepID=UPI003CCB2AF7
RSPKSPPVQPCTDVLRSSTFVLVCTPSSLRRRRQICRLSPPEMSSSQSKRKRLRAISNPLHSTQQESQVLLRSHASENSPDIAFNDADYDDEEDIDLEDPPASDDVEEEVEMATSNSKSKTKKIPKRAAFWKYFKEIKDDAGNTERGICIFCDTSYAAKSKTNGTTNLSKHWKSCKENPDNLSKGTTQTTLHLEQVDELGNCKVKSTIVDVDEVRRKLCKLIIGEELPFSFVQKFLFRDLFASACPIFKVPSRSTITRDAYKMYADEREKLILFFKENSQRICLTTDTWTSIQNVNYMALTAHFIDNQWNLQKRILNFCTISGHKGVEIARDIEDCLRSWDLSDKIFTLTVDNAKANDIACTRLKEMLIGNGNCINSGKNLHIRCCAHIANLIVKDGLKEQIDFIDKVRNVIKFVRSSPMRLRMFKEEALKLKIDSNCSLVSDVPTRWNYTYVMLDVALKYKQVFPRIDTPIDDDGNSIGHITAEEWAKVEVIVDFLKEFYDFTNSVSGSDCVLINKVYLYIGGIVKILNEKAQSVDGICSSMALRMKTKCDKYWDGIEKLNVFIFIGMLLDPSCKFNMLKSTVESIYGEKRGFELALQVKGTAAEIFDEYKLIYAPSSSSSSSSSNAGSSNLRARPELIGGKSALNTFYKEVMNRSMKMSQSTSSVYGSELDKFLGEEECYECDVLTWWRQDGHRFPILARMAHDVFAIPISTVPSESAFSAGGRTVDKFRSKLDPTMVQALLCTQDWILADIRSLDKDDDAWEEVQYYRETEKISEDWFKKYSLYSSFIRYGEVIFEDFMIYVLVFWVKTESEPIKTEPNPNRTEHIRYSYLVN